jgi:hypothetical protein
MKLSQHPLLTQLPPDHPLATTLHTDPTLVIIQLPVLLESPRCRLLLNQSWCTRWLAGVELEDPTNQGPSIEMKELVVSLRDPKEVGRALRRNDANVGGQRIHTNISGVTSLNF